MSLMLNKPRLDNLAGDIWKSAERLRGKFKAYEYQGVILPIIVIRRLECVLLAWREAKSDEVLARRPGQQLIAAFVREKDGEFRVISAQIERQIETLTAYRKSLIHECVTGQRRITEEDVRRATRVDSIHCLEHRS